MTIPDGIAVLIFDVDQTLVDTGTAWRAALDAACTRLAAITPGLAAADAAAAYRQVSDDLWSRYDTALAPLRTHHAMRLHAWQQALAACGITLPPARAREQAEFFAAAQLEHITPGPQLPGLLARARARYRVAACTNGDDAWTRAKLASAGLDRLMETVTCGITEKIRKPDPGLLLRCCAALGVPPAPCLHAGDDWANDITAAAAAGLHPAWITPSATAAAAPPPAVTWHPSAAAFLTALLASGKATS